MLSRLESEFTEEQATDAALIVSELVTNSVTHASVGSEETVVVELARSADRLLIAVTDPGSRLEPRMGPGADRSPGHLGLFLVDQLAAAWGFERDPVGPTRVWCELLLDPVPPAQTNESLAQGS